MKSIKPLPHWVAILASIALLQGCASPPASSPEPGAAKPAEAAFGTVTFVNNTLQVTREASLDEAWGAANAALVELQMPVTLSTREGATGRLEAHNAQDKPVVIQLSRKTENVTDVQITVGTLDNEDNQSEAQRVYNKIKAHF